MVCLMRKSHPLAGRALTPQDYLDADHLVPTPYAVGQRGVIDLQLVRERLKRKVVASVPTSAWRRAAAKRYFARRCACLPNIAVRWVSLHG